MRILLESEDALRVEPSTGPLTIEAPSADRTYSPFHMVASGLAICTLAVLQSWAASADIDAHGLTLDVRWAFVEDPHRVGAYDITVAWPGLDPRRHAAAQRVAAMCAVKSTLAHPPRIDVAVTA